MWKYKGVVLNNDAMQIFRDEQIDIPDKLKFHLDASAEIIDESVNYDPQKCLDAAQKYYDKNDLPQAAKIFWLAAQRTVKIAFLEVGVQINSQDGVSFLARRLLSTLNEPQRELMEAYFFYSHLFHRYHNGVADISEDEFEYRKRHVEQFVQKFDFDRETVKKVADDAEVELNGILKGEIDVEPNDERHRLKVIRRWVPTNDKPRGKTFLAGKHYDFDVVFR